MSERIGEIRQEDNGYVLEAMLMIIGWNNTRDMCLHRTNCGECPCFKDQICSRKNSDQILQQAAEVFQDFLDK